MLQSLSACSFFFLLLSFLNFFVSFLYQSGDAACDVTKPVGLLIFFIFFRLSFYFCTRAAMQRCYKALHLLHYKACRLTRFFFFFSFFIYQSGDAAMLQSPSPPSQTAVRGTQWQDIFDAVYIYIYVYIIYIYVSAVIYIYIYIYMYVYMYIYMYIRIYIYIYTYIYIYIYVYNIYIYIYIYVRGTQWVPFASTRGFF